MLVKKKQFAQVTVPAPPYAASQEPTVLPGTADDTDDTSDTTKMTGRQLQDGDWSLPAGLDGSGIGSMWLAVAIWSLRQARPVTRDDIAQAFRISPRRAADVVSYLLTTRSDRVVCERKIHRVASGHRVATLRVFAVVAGPAEDGPPASSARSHKHSTQGRDAEQQAGRVGGSRKNRAVREQEQAQMRRWFLSRP